MFDGNFGGRVLVEVSGRYRALIFATSEGATREVLCAPFAGESGRCTLHAVGELDAAGKEQALDDVFFSCHHYEWGSHRLAHGVDGAYANVQIAEYGH